MKLRREAQPPQRGRAWMNSVSTKGSNGNVVGSTSDRYGTSPEARTTRMRNAFFRVFGIAHKQADLVIVYEHNHIFDKPFGTIFSEELPERLVPPAWIKKWTHEEVDAGADIVVMHGAPLRPRRRDLSQPAHLLRSGRTSSLICRLQAGLTSRSSGKV